MGVNNWVKKEGKTNSFVQCEVFCFTEKENFFLFVCCNSYKYFVSQSKENEKLKLYFKLQISLCAQLDFFLRQKAMKCSGSWISWF